VALADREPIGPGTTRVTIGAAAVDRALRLLDAHPWSYARVAEAAGTIVATSENRIGRYSRRLGAVAAQRYGGRGPEAILRAATGRSSSVDVPAE
jgi:transcription initiation factor TFIIB